LKAPHLSIIYNRNRIVVCYGTEIWKWCWQVVCLLFHDQQVLPTQTKWRRSGGATNQRWRSM